MFSCLRPVTGTLAQEITKEAMRISEKYRIGRIYDAIYDVIRHPGGTDHSIDQVTIDRNDEAKDYMRLNAIRRRQDLNQSL